MLQTEEQTKCVADTEFPGTTSEGGINWLITHGLGMTHGKTWSWREQVCCWGPRLHPHCCEHPLKGIQQRRARILFLQWVQEIHMWPVFFFLFKSPLEDGKQGSYSKTENSSWFHLLTHIKTNLKWNKRPGTIKLIEENKSGKVLDRVLSNHFLIWHEKQKQLKQKIHKWDYVKLKSFLISKETINKMKRSTTKWKKKYINHISDKGLVHKIYEELISQ